MADGYRRLVRLVARLFYAEDVPPPEAPNPDEVPAPRRATPQQGPQLGLGVVVLDALTRREWVAEDYVPRHVEGSAPDPKPPGLAQQLRIHPKLLRRVLRYLERDQILAREHRQEKAGRKRRAGDAAQEAVAASMLAGQSAVAADGEAEAAQKHHTHSYCCIDYPRFIDTLQLRLYLMKKQLKDAEADSTPIQGYQCQGCGQTYTSMDAPRLLDFATGEFVCEDCGGAVHQQFSGGQTGDEAERKRRREASRVLLAQFEKAVQPVRDLLAQLRGKQPPDYGPLQDWAIAKQQEAVRRERRIRSGGRAAADDPPTFANVELDTGDSAAAAAEEEAAPRELPPWMLRDGIDSTGAAALQNGDAALDAAREAAEREAVERAYVQAWLERANALNTGAADASRDEKGDLEDDGAAIQGKKRVKTDFGWASVPVKADVKPEANAVEAESASHVTPENEAEGDEPQYAWEDADRQSADAAVAVNGVANSHSDQVAAPGAVEEDENIDWEDT